MAYKNEFGSTSFVAGATINANRFVKISGADNTVIQAAAATDHGIGVAEYGGASGTSVRVIQAGIAKVIVGAGGVTRGTRVTADATGQAVAWATTNAVFGEALETRAVGEICPVQLQVPALPVA